MIFIPYPAFQKVRNTFLPRGVPHKPHPDSETASELHSLQPQTAGNTLIPQKWKRQNITIDRLFLYAGFEKKNLSEDENFEAVVSAIGIKPILKKKPLECSGGERARAVFARGIIMKPQIILADEPTASLDMENRERIVTLLFRMNKEFNTTIITVTHDLEIANRHDRVIHLERRK